MSSKPRTICWLDCENLLENKGSEMGHTKKFLNLQLWELDSVSLWTVGRWLVGAGRRAGTSNHHLYWVKILKMLLEQKHT
jgi:hypothetical protein